MKPENANLKSTLYKLTDQYLCKPFCLTLIIVLNVVFEVNAQQKMFFADSVRVPFSTLNIAGRDTAYYLVNYRTGTSALKNFVDKSNVMRVLSDTSAIVAGVLAKDSAHLVSLFKINNLWKLSDALIQEIPEKSYTKKYTLKLRCKVAIDVLQKKLGQIKICDVRNNTVLIECKYGDLIERVLPLPCVTYVGLEAHVAVTESRVLDNNLAPNNITFVHHLYPELKGQEMTISIKEDLYDKEDIDLAGRHVESLLASPTVDQHATDMATLIAGAGNSFITGKGVAPAASITSSNIDVLGPDEEYALLDVGVQNHSYGTVIENFYGALAEDFDESANTDPNIVHVFSSGNDGTSAPTAGTYAGISGYANLTGNFKMTKNTLIVGSVDTVGRTISFSSKGPAYDGRIKPELVAYSVAGTSNSAAIVSGTIALLQQEYKINNNSLPPSALVKAFLINGAIDAGRTGIDFETGYGNMDAQASIRMLKENKYRTGSVSNGEIQIFTISVPAQARNLKITLVWNDIPAHANDAKALVNDLDIHVLTPSTSVVLPWVLDHQPSGLQQPALRNEDHLNNIEQITLQELQEGDYTVSVKGYSVSGAQDFYIAYQWDDEELFQWYYPTGSDNFPYNGEAGTYFRWKSTLDETQGKLEINLNSEWITLHESIDLATGHYRYTPPMLNAIAQARMTIGGQVFYTDFFTVSRPVQVKVGFNCQDSILLNWNRVEGATYHLKHYANQALEGFRVISDTSIVLQKDEFTSTLFAVHPEFNNGIKAIQGYTFDYMLQGVSCYVSSFTALAAEDGISLNLEIGTTHGIGEVVLERLSVNGFETVFTSELTSKSNTFKDTSPIEGLNTYRARIRFVNGEELLTDEASEYYLNKTLYLVYPNPVVSGAEILLIAKQFEELGQQFIMYSSTGSVVLLRTLNTDRESISIPPLSPGVYLYHIATEDGFFKGKLMVTN